MTIYANNLWGPCPTGSLTGYAYATCSLQASLLTMCNSNGISILDLEGSFDSGVGGEGAGEYKHTPKILFCQKSWQNL